MTLSRRRLLQFGSLACGGLAIGLVARQVNSRTAALGGLRQAAAISPANADFRQQIAAVIPSYVAPEGLFAPQRGDVRLVVFSDINSRYGSTHYRAEVEQSMEILAGWQPDLVLCAGDMVAGQQVSLTQPEIQAMWQAFDRRILALVQAQGLPFAFTLGNHDASSAQLGGKWVFGLERELAAAYWQPRLESLGLNLVDATGFPFYYSFLMNDLFYLVWDASSANISEAQIAWADRLLASPEAQQAKLRIVMGHLPFYAVSQGRDRAGEILTAASDLQVLLERHQVHTYICGHHHAYYPAHVGALEFLHCGALGSGPRTWLNRTDPPMQTLTVMDVFFDPEPRTVYTTYDMGRRDVINLVDVPRQIVGPNGRLLRRDLEWSDLTVSEQNQGYIPSLH